MMTKSLYNTKFFEKKREQALNEDIKNKTSEYIYKYAPDSSHEPAELNSFYNCINILYNTYKGYSYG